MASNMKSIKVRYTNIRTWKDEICMIFKSKFSNEYHFTERFLILPPQNLCHFRKMKIQEKFGKLENFQNSIFVIKIIKNDGNQNYFAHFESFH